MKTTLTASLAAFALSLSASAQIATFDYRDVTAATSPANTSWTLDADTQDNCVTGATGTKNGIGNSVQKYGICTSGWSTGSTIDWNKTLDLDLSFASTTTGSIDSVTFFANKPLSVNSAGPPQRWAMRLLKDGVATGSVQTGMITNVGATTTFGANTATFNESIMANSAYTVQFTTYGGQTDRFVYVGSAEVNGSLNCVPEPSSVLLSTLAAIGLLTNRKRK